MPFTALTCQPEDLAMLQDVYKRVLKETWFAHNETTERDFAKAVVRLFQQGMTDEEQLLAAALAIARDRFSSSQARSA